MLGKVVGVLLALFIGVRLEGKLRPRPMAMALERFFLDNPVRRRWFGPDRVLSVMGDLTSRQVGEIGVGVGVVLEALARAVGPGGGVRGIDVQPDAVRRATRRMTARSLADRVSVACADASRLPWEANSLDWVVLVSVWGEIPPSSRPGVLREIARVLHPQGRLAVCEYWPDPHFQRPERLTRELAAVGFQVVQSRRWPLVYTLSAECVDREKDEL